MNPYAAGTSVPVERSRAELDSLLSKHGATQRGIVSDDSAHRAAVMFVLDGRQYRLEVPLPAKPVPKQGKEPRGWFGWSTPQRDAWAQKEQEQSCRERWRAVVLVVKAKLEYVKMGLSTVEKEFFADLVLPGGETLHGAMRAKIEHALREGAMPTLLLPGGP